MGNVALFDAAEDKKLAVSCFFFACWRSKVPSGFVRGLETATGRRQKKKTGYCYPLITPPRARRGRAAEAGMEPEDAAAGVQDDVLLESLLPDDLTELGAAQAEKAQRAVVWRSNDDVTKELQQRLAAGNGQRYDVKQGDLRQPNVK